MLKCQYCNFEGKSLVSHIKNVHNESPAEYKKKYPGKLQIVTDAQCAMRKKIANSGGTWRRVEYWTKRGYTEIEAAEVISSRQRDITRSRKYNDDEIVLNPAYWIKNGYSLEDATKKISEIQAARSSRSSKFTGKSHTIDSKFRISAAMKNHIDVIGKETWISHFGKFSGRSKIEAECYSEIKELICGDLLANVYINGYVVDMLYTNKVIEFNGDYWHANPKIYLSNNSVSYPKGIILVDDIWKKDATKISVLQENGYQVYTIWESEWKSNKNKILNEIKVFINDSI
jgi:hypothetical protein